MADNIAVTAGSGTTIAADDIGGVLHQRVKISQGADGSATDVSSAAPLQVTLANTGANSTPVVVDLGANNDVTVTGTVDLGATDNAVLDAIEADTTAILADTAAIEIATEATQAALETVGGLVVNLGANNDVTVTGTVDLGATDNAVLDTIAAKDFATQTTLAAINAKMVTGTDIGDVTINNSTGAAAVNIQDGGNTITVDGTVTADLGAVDNAVLDAIAASTAAIETAVEGTLTVTGGGGGVEYTEGDTDASITGSVAMMEVGGDAVQPIQGTVAGGLLVNLGSNNDVTVTGTVDLGATDNAVLDTIDSVLDTINAKLVTGTDIGDVTINNASGASAVNIQDGGNTITVDGTVTANLSAVDNAVLDALVVDTGEIQAAVEAIQAAQLPDGHNVTIDNPGDIGGGTQYTEDAAAAADPVGNALILVRDDVLSGQTTTDGDNVAVRGTDKGEMYVKHADTVVVDLGANNDVTVTSGAITETNSTAILADTANMDTNLGTIAGAVAGGQVQVDIVADGAGLATAANQSTIIGHVDGVETLLGTIDADTGNLPTIETNTDFGTVVGGGTEATALRVTIANNSTGVLSIDDNGAAITVDGTVTAELSAVDNTVLDNIDADLTTVIGHVDGIETVLGTIDTDTGNMATSLGSLDNAVDGNYLNVNMNVAGTDVVSGSGTATGALRVELPTNGTGVLATVGAVTAITNALPAGTNALGKILPPDVDVTAHTNYARKYYTNAGAVTDGIIWSPAAGKRWHVTSLFINVSAAATVTLEDDKAGGDDPVMKMELAANSGIMIPFDEKYPLASGEDAADLIITTTAGNVYVTCVGYEV